MDHCKWVFRSTWIVIDCAGTQIKTQGSMCWKDVVVKTVYNKMQRPLAGPVTLETNVLLRWPGRGQTTPPQVVMGVQAGLLLVHVGQEHFLCLQHLLAVLYAVSNACGTGAPFVTVTPVHVFTVVWFAYWTGMLCTCNTWLYYTQ